MVKKSIRKNYIYNVTYQILTILTPFITAPYLSRVLTPAGIGNVSFAESIVAYFTLFATMGIATYGQREISYVQNDKEQRTIVFWNSKILEVITSLIALIVYIVYAINQANSILYLVLSMNILAKTADITWFFQGLEEFGKIVIRNCIIKFLQIVYIFALVKTRDDMVIYAIGLAGFTLLSSISLWTYLPNYIQKISFSKLHVFKDLPSVLSLFVPTIAIQIYTVLDKTMIGVITKNAAENGYYEQAIKISKMTLHIVTALGTVMVPRIGFLFNSGRHDDVKRYMYRGYQFVWFLGVPFCLGLVTCASNFVPWFFGLGYEKVIILLQILSFLILAIGINNVTGIQYLIPTKRQNIFTFTVIIGAVVNFSLNSLLIPRFQSAGAAVASVAAETVIAVIQLIIVRKELSLWHVIMIGRNYYIAGAVMAAVVFLISGKLMATVFNTVFLIMVGAICYFTILLLLRDPFFLDNMKKGTDKLIHKKAV